MIRFSLLGAAIGLWIVAGTARAELPAGAQAAIDQGLSALEAKNFSQANECFQEACALGPVADVYATLGRAEAKVPGRELRAICWLAASLAAKPPAADAVAIKSEIDRLQIRSRERILALAQSAQEAAEAMPAGEAHDQALGGVAGIWTTLGDGVRARKSIDLIDADAEAMPAGEVRDQLRRSAAALWEKLGDETQARKTIDRIDGKGPKSDALSTLACAYSERATRQFEAGDPAGAQASLAQAQSAVALMPFRSDTYPQYRIATTYLQIARRQISTGDFVGARASIATAQTLGDAIKDSWRSEVSAAVATTELSLGRAQLKAGDTAGARETFARVLARADAVEQHHEKYQLLMDIADAQTKAGDLEGARASLAAALPLVTVYNDAGHARMEIVRAQVKTGDLATAQKTADLIIEGPPSWRYDARMAIAEGQIKAGDLEGARKSLTAALDAVNLYEDKGETKFTALRLIADAQTSAGDVVGAMAILATATKLIDALFPNAQEKAWAQEGIALGQFKAGDKAAALLTAGLIEHPGIRAETMGKLAGSPAALPSVRSAPMEPPRQSEILALLPASSARMDADSWIWSLREGLDEPWFTAYPDFSDFMAMADLIQRTPVKHGMQAAYRPLDKVSSLISVGFAMARAQQGVDANLRRQFNH